MSQISSTIFLTIQKPGLSGLVQDRGRPGYQKFGVPVGGFMDKHSAHMANWLVGNQLDDPLIEISMSGPQIHFDSPCNLAITGADISASINGQVIPRYQTVQVSENSVLSFGKLNSGCRGYLALGGKLKVTRWLESASAASHETVKLTPESLLQKDSKLALTPNQNVATKAFAPIPEFDNKIKVRILPGPEYNQFSGESISFLINHEFIISKDSNRMGYRLEGDLWGFEPETEVISSGIIPGTIQVTNSSSLIILMADAQTSGGYPRIANIITADLDKVAQLKPGDSISFQLATPREAILEWSKYIRKIKEFSETK